MIEKTSNAILSILTVVSAKFMNSKKDRSDNKRDQRAKFEEIPFDYQVTKDNKLLIYWFGKQVKILTGKESEKWQTRLANAQDESEQQLHLAKVTGNFKRGNENKEKQ